jgi:hypothetical protein
MSGNPPTPQNSTLYDTFMLLCGDLKHLVKMLWGWFKAFISWLSTGFLPEPDREPLAPPPAAVSGTAATATEAITKVAQMEYQLELDKRKAQDQYRYAWSQIVWDKLIFAGFLAVFGSLGYWWVNKTLDDRRKEDALATENRRQEETRSLERFKLEEARQRFYIDKRLEALLKVAAAMSDVTRVLFDYTKEKKDAPDKEAREEYSKALARAREVINQAEILFGVGVRKDMDRYYEVLHQIMLVGVTKCERYRGLIMDLSRQFDDVCHAAFTRGEPTGDGVGEEQAQLTLEAIGAEDRDSMPPQKYLDRQFRHWQATRKANASKTP